MHSALKAVFALLTLFRAEKKRIEWGRLVLIFSYCVTAGLAALYLIGKVTSRW